MTLSGFLKSRQLTDPPIDFEWTRVIANSFVAPMLVDDHPALFDSVALINTTAAFALSVVCVEWVTARFSKLTPIQDALPRLQAAWAATIDPRYAHLPKPPYPYPEKLDPVSEPLITALRILTAAHYYLEHPDQDDASVQLSATTLSLIVLAEHISPHEFPFNAWFKETLSRTAARFPAQDLPRIQHPPISRDFFDSASAWTGEALRDCQDQLRQTLNPKLNPYLRSAKDMHELGFEGNPYPGGVELGTGDPKPNDG